MKVYHPQAPYQGIPAENVFRVADDMGVEVGVGYVICFYQPDLFPERPLNLYLHMEAPQAAKYMLFGAVLARAKQLRDMYPNVKARIYTQAEPEDSRNCDFYLQNGFNLDDAEDVVRLAMPDEPSKVPMSCAIANVPLNTEAEQNYMLMRLNQSRISPLNLGYLELCRQKPHFLALALYKGNSIIGEVLLTGEGYRCELVSMYVVPQFRRMGMGKALLHRALEMLKAEGVTQVSAAVLRRSPAQCAMAQAFGATFLKTISLYPGVNLE
ncbi:MAG: GNAT family N-acetyltransferase [Clostridia bacterium]|nr:GNAT family N-acetyltransferase [Clostridia bacterium]